MASVSVLSSTDFRANLTQTQNPAQEADEPFSLLLNSVADVKADLQRPDAPKAAERRDPAPAKQQKPEADADRQAKRQTKDAAKPETKPQPETSAPAAAAAGEETVEETETETDGEDTSAADALLAIALGEPQQQAAPQPVAAEADVTVPSALVPAVATDAEAAPEVQTAPALAAIAGVAEDASAQAETAATAQKPAKVDIQLEVAPPSGDDKIKNLQLPENVVEAILSKSKPSNATAHFKLEGQAQTQPGSVNVSTASALQGPTQLEMLNAAISKHQQLSLGLEANDAQPADAQKPLVSSNAVAPNFAMTAQVNAPVQVQTQQVVETARAVPLENLAVEIATRAGKGERRFDIRLDPPELGRIDVRLEIDSKGNTTTKLIVERSETLDMLKQDARGLEKALQNAGLKTDAGGLEFSLRQDTQTQQGHQNHAPEMRGRPDLAATDSEIMTEIAVGNASLAAQIRGGVDIRI